MTRGARGAGRKRLAPKAIAGALACALRRGLSRGLPLALAAGLAGCAGYDSSLVTMAVGHNEALDRIDRNTTLLNILRASDEQPLNFTTLSYMGGNGNVGASAGVNEARANLFAPVQAFSANINLNASRGFTFSLGSLDNEQFMRGFLADLPLEKIYFFTEGTSLRDDVLWTLVADSVAYDDAVGPRRVYTNRLEPESWGAFQSIIAQAGLLGLTLEEVIEQVPVGPRLSRDEALNQISLVTGSWGDESRPGGGRPLLVETGDSDPARTHQVVMRTRKVRFCFNPPRPEAWRYTELELLCQSTGAQQAFTRWRDQRQAAGTPLPLGPMAWRDIKTRSPREAFYFLGRVVRAQLGRPAKTWRVGDATVNPERPPRPLLTVICGTPPKGDPLAVAVYRGQTCHVPRDDGSDSAQVFQYLSLLVTLSKIPGAIPASPAMLVR